MLLKLVEETQPDIIDNNYLFQPHHWKVQNWIEQLEDGEELFKPSEIMKDANAMWSFRNRFKNGELDVNEWPDVEVEETIKVAADTVIDQLHQPHNPIIHTSTVSVHNNFRYSQTKFKKPVTPDKNPVKTNDFYPQQKPSKKPVEKPVKNPVRYE